MAQSQGQLSWVYLNTFWSYLALILQELLQKLSLLLSFNCQIHEEQIPMYQVMISPNFRHFYDLTGHHCSSQEIVLHVLLSLLGIDLQYMQQKVLPHACHISPIFMKKHPSVAVTESDLLCFFGKNYLEKSLNELENKNIGQLSTL